MPPDSFAVAIGASSGGVDALLQIASALPAGFPAPVLVTQHIGNLASMLPELMHARGANPAVHPADGDALRPGTIYVAPPDRHLLVQGERVRLSRGPKENYCRPAIDPMFRSVALARGSRAIGVVLSGQLDDGTAGLKAIKECGGTAIVQDPATALEPGMPVSALDNVDVDLCLRVADIVPALERRVGAPAWAGPADPPEHLRREQSVQDGIDPMENLSAIAEPSTLTCPDCGGSLWELKDHQPLRYRCHTGHAFTGTSLVFARGDAAEHSLWSGVRALHEREYLLRRVARVARAHGEHGQAEAGERRADEARMRADELVRIIERKERGA